MNKGFILKGVAAAWVFCVLFSGCVDLFGPGGGGDQSDQEGCIEFEVPTEGVLWAVSSDPDRGGDVILTISISGTSIAAVDVQTGSTSCGGFDGPPVTGSVEFNGDQIQLSAVVGDADGDGVLEAGGCTIELSGTIAPCGNATSFLPGVATDIFAVDGQGTATVEGVEYSIADLDVTVIRLPEPTPCEEPFDSLAEINWRFTSEDPFALGSPGDDLVLNVSGYEDSVYGLDIFGSLTPDDPDSFFNCSGAISASDVFFDGQEFRLHVQTEAGGNFEACTLDFEGQATGCESAPPEFVETPSQAFQLSGTAIVTQGDLQGEFTDPFLELNQFGGLITFPEQ